MKYFYRLFDLAVSIWYRCTFYMSNVLAYMDFFPEIICYFPFHIGIIPDGNRRFFKTKNITNKKGYSDMSLQSLFRVIRYLQKCKAKSVSVFVLSESNLNRSKEEVEIYNDLILKMADDKKCSDSYKINIYGDLDLIPIKQAACLKRMEKKSLKNDFIVNFMIGYSSISEIKGLKKYEKTTENLPLDYLIRTGNTHRFSDFMLNSISRGACCEFLTCYWPEVNPLVLWAVIIKNKVESLLFTEN